MRNEELEELEAAMNEQQAEGPERLWAARPYLTTIQQFAQARIVSPWSVLGIVMLRALATVPPNVRLPATIGGEVALNMFVALVGPSGIGKSASSRVACEAVQLVQTFEELPVGSGEGLVKAYAARELEEIEGQRSYTLKWHTRSVLFSVEEVDQLAAQGNRSGSTLMPQLRSAFNGEQLGSTYATVEKSVTLPRYSYRLGLTVGVQPERSGGLLREQHGGTPQRFVWLPALDRDMPAIAPPEPLPYRLPATHWPTSDTCMGIPNDVAEAIREKRRAVVRGNGDPLDGHLMLTRLKVAAALAVLDGRTAVNREDWRLSGYVMQRSKQSRDECVAALKSVEEAKARERGKLDEVRAQGREHLKLDRVANWIVEKVRANPNGVTKGTLRRDMAGRDRNSFDAALSVAISSGRVERSGEEVFPCFG